MAAALQEMRFSDEGRGFMATAAVVAAVPKRFANDGERFCRALCGCLGRRSGRGGGGGGGGGLSEG